MLSNLLARGTRVGECLEWSGALNKSGYGIVKVAGKVKLVHRVAAEAVHGESPLGAWVLHKCNNRKCFEPSHLYYGTALENAADRDARGLKRPDRGINSTLAALSIEQVAAVKLLHISGMTQENIAFKMRCSRSLVGMVIRGERYVE